MFDIPKIVYKEGCNLLNPYLLTDLLSIPLNKLPWFKLSSTGAPQDLWETEVGDFWSHANDQFWEKSGGAPATVWPREYLKKRMRLVNSLWKVADTNLGMEFSIPGLHNSFEYTVLELLTGGP